MGAQGQPGRRSDADTRAIVARLVGADLGSGSTGANGDPLERKCRQAVAAKGAAVVQAFTSAAPGQSSLADRMRAARSSCDPFEAARKLAADGRIRRAIDVAERKAKGRRP